jgi:hypothetical protein
MRSSARDGAREIGGVLGVAVLAAVFASQGDYETPTAFVDGFTPASRSAPSPSPSGPRWRG